jgi:hypothetical protein
MTAILTGNFSAVDRRCVFSPERAYRYTLWREWSVQEIALTVQHDVDPRPFDYVQFIGLNPSTADEREDDNTIRRCIDYAKRWGFGALCMTNLFAWRDTDPKKMKRAIDPVGPDNDSWLLAIAQDAGQIVCCWGSHGIHRGRHESFLQTPEFFNLYARDRLFAFGLTDNGQPKHPLRLKKLLRPASLRFFKQR